MHVVGLLGRCTVVLCGGAFVGAFVEGGCAGAAIRRDGELLSLEESAFLWGELGIAEGVHGGLKGNAHG